MSDLNIAESTDRWNVVQNGVVSETVTNVKDERTGPKKGGLNEYAAAPPSPPPDERPL